MTFFDFFRSRTAKEFADEAKEKYGVPEVPKIEPPKKEEGGKIYYRMGLTDNNRVAFSMGYSEITMNKVGCQTMIDQISFYMGQLTEQEETDAE